MIVVVRLIAVKLPVSQPNQQKICRVGQLLGGAGNGLPVGQDEGQGGGGVGVAGRGGGGGAVTPAATSSSSGSMSDVGYLNVYCEEEALGLGAPAEWLSSLSSDYRARHNTTDRSGCACAPGAAASSVGSPPSSGFQGCIRNYEIK